MDSVPELVKKTCFSKSPGVLVGVVGIGGGARGVSLHNHKKILRWKRLHRRNPPALAGILSILSQCPAGRQGVLKYYLGLTARATKSVTFLARLAYLQGT